MAIALALLASFLISFSTIIMKKCIDRTNPTSAMLVLTAVSTLILLVLSIPTVHLDFLKSRAFLFLILAGIFSPSLVRWLYFISLDRLGPSVSSSVLSTGPAITAVLAIIFLKEKLTLPVSLGILLLIIGIIIFGRDINANGQYAVRKKQDLIY